MRTQLASATDTVKLGINLGAVGMVLLSLYFVVLHWVLFRVGRGMRRGVAAFV